MSNDRKNGYLLVQLKNVLTAPGDNNRLKISANPMTKIIFTMKKALHIFIMALLLFTGSRPSLAQTKTLSLKEALTMAKQGNKTLQVQILEEKMP